MRNGIHRLRSSTRTDEPTFVVERFGWGAPDRLEVAGTFSGLATDTAGGAVLTVYGEDGSHRLPAIGDAEAEASADGDHWAAEFAWLEAPVAFDRARLELGTSVAVELPAPGTEADGQPLAVELLEESEEPEADEPDAPADPAETPATPAAAGDPAERLRLETQLLEQAEQLEEVRAAAQRAEAALQRAEADLVVEREARAADAERFRKGLAQVRASAEEALAAAEEARARDEAELGDLRAQLAELDSASGELDAARIELDEARTELDAVRGELESARGTLDAAQEDAQALVDRLSGRR